MLRESDQKILALLWIAYYINMGEVLWSKYVKNSLTALDLVERLSKADLVVENLNLEIRGSK